MKDTTLWTALITPMHGDGSIHYEDLEKLARRQEEAGNGILILGSTGEGLALSDHEKQDVVEFMTGLGLSVPVMAGVGGFDLKKQKDWVVCCNRAGVDAFLFVTPLYAKPGVTGQIEWFGALLDATDKPCMIYNIPSRTGAKLSPEVLQEFESHPSLWAVKEASGSLFDFQQFRETAPSIPLYSGDDALLPFFAVAGCSGLVSVASNVWPAATKRYVELCLAGQTDSLFPVWTDAVKALFSASNPIPAKRLLCEKNVITTPVLRPPLTEKELESAGHLKQTDQSILNWHQKNR